MDYERDPDSDEEAYEQRSMIEPAEPLEDAFASWYETVQDGQYRDTFEQAYDAALENLVSVDSISSAALNGLLLQHPDKQAGAGPFIAAAHNLSDEQIVYLDAERRIGGVGYRLPAEKTLVTDADTPAYGKEAKGMLVPRGRTYQFEWGDILSGESLVFNEGTVESTFTYENEDDAPAMLINAGTVQDGFGNEAIGTPGPHLNIGTVEGSFLASGSGTHDFNAGDAGDIHGDVVDIEDTELASYLEDLDTILQQPIGPLRDDLAEYSPVPRITIKRDIEEYMEDRGDR